MPQVHRRMSLLEPFQSSNRRETRLVDDKEQTVKKLFVCVLMGLMSGCCTIVHGMHQDVGMSSAPAGAKVFVDSVYVGTTPIVVPINRGSTHVVRLEKPGYETFDTTLTHSVSGWIWGNLAFGGLIGLGLDAATGSIYNIYPEQVYGALEPDALTKSVFNTH